MKNIIKSLLFLMAGFFVFAMAVPSQGIEGQEGQVSKLIQEAKEARKEGRLFVAKQKLIQALELSERPEIRKEIKDIEAMIETARSLREEGKKLIKVKQYGEACKKLSKSLRYFNDPKLKSYLRKYFSDYIDKVPGCIAEIVESMEFRFPKVDGVYLDWCLTWGADCGKPAADFFCKQNGFDSASEFEQATDVGNTKILKTGQLCQASFCDGFKFIKCTEKKEPESDALKEYKFEKANYWGNDFKIYNDFHDMEECARLCDQNPKCKVATFHGPEGPGPWKNKCILRNAVGPRHTEQPDTYSWIKPEKDDMGANVSIMGQHSITLAGRPDFYLTQRDFLATMTDLASIKDRKEATFNIVPGLADNKCISFQSISHPDHYLRHQWYKLKLHKIDGSDLFREDATFCPVPGFADSSLFSFKSHNYPDYYLRYRGPDVYIEKVSDDLFKKEATFKIVPPLWVQ